MTIFVAGASGNTGSVVAESLLGRGEKVRVLARDEAKVGGLARAGAEVVKGDLFDAGALDRALEGTKAAYVLLPPSHTESDFAAYQDRVSRALASALGRAKTKRVVLLSSVGAELPSGTGPIAGLHRTEKLFAELSAAVTFLRPSYFLENFGSALGGIEAGVFPTFFPGDFAFEAVATKDIGLVAADELVRASRGFDFVEIQGPEKVTARVAAKALSELVGKELALAEGPANAMAEALRGYGFQADLAAMYQEMTEAMIAGKIKPLGTGRSVRGTTDVREVFAKLLGGKK